MMNFRSDMPTCQIVLATPAVVDLLLSMNADNRKLRKSHVKWLAAQFASGDYVCTNQGVGVDRMGRLIDGQHRLEALREAGYPAVHILVVYGLSPDAGRAVDIGVNRTISDLMHFAFERPEATAAMLAAVRFWGLKNKTPASRTKPTPREMADWYATLAPILADAYPAFGSNRPPAPILAAVCNAVLENDGDRRPIEFIRRVYSGVRLEERSPELMLNKYIFGSSATTGGKAQIERYRKAEFAIDAHLNGRECTRLGGYVRRGSFIKPDTKDKENKSGSEPDKDRPTA